MYVHSKIIKEKLTWIKVERQINEIEECILLRHIATKHIHTQADIMIKRIIVNVIRAWLKKGKCEDDNVNKKISIFQLIIC